MNSICYLLKKSILNIIKKNLKKPGTYLLLIIIPLYIIGIAFSFNTILSDFGLTTPAGLAFIISAFSLFTLPANLICYAKKKGLIFKQSDVHFLFQSPVHPKLVLIYAAIKNFVMSLLITIIISIAAIWLFQLPVYKAIIFILVAGALETITELCFMLALYGNELLSEKTISAIRIGIFIILGAFILIAFLIINQSGSLSSIKSLFQNPMIQAVPLLGWYIAFIHLLIIGPTTANVICTGCYVLLCVITIIYAIKMPCTGLYYEEAMTFADDYADARKRAAKGEVAKVGKKKKFKNATISYKGNYAKAIFYRQLLEYKKNRFFIFGGNTLICLILGILVTIFLKNADVDPTLFTSKLRYGILPGLSAYLVMMFSGFSAKWQKELECAYTFLIPDTGIKKLFYSTLIDHARFLIDGALLIIPCSYALQLNIAETLLMLFVYYLLQANKLYVEVLVESLLRAIFGATGRTFVRLCFTVLCFSVAATATVLITILCDSAFIGLLAGCLFHLLITIAIASIGAIRYERMEMPE